MKYFRDKILPGLIVLIVSFSFTFIEKIITINNEDNRKNTDDRQDELIQDRINHDNVQDSIIVQILKKSKN